MSAELVDASPPPDVAPEDDGRPPDAALALPDASAPIDAFRPDASTECRHTVDLMRWPAEVLAQGEALPIVHGSVTPGVGLGMTDVGTLHLSPIGAGIAAGARADLVERQERLIIEWTDQATDISMAINGVDGDGSGSVGFSYQIDGGVITGFTGSETAQLEFPSAQRIDITGVTLDGVAVLGLIYTLCPPMSGTVPLGSAARPEYD